jgi:hypothetical protein
MVHAAWSHNTIFSMALVGVSQSQSIVNVLHFEATAAQEALYLSDAGAQADGLVLAADWVTNCLATWRLMHPNYYTLSKLSVQVLERPGLVNHKLVATDYTTGLPVVGNSALGSTSGSQTDCADIKWRSLLAGKSRRGRTYVGPLSDEMNAAGLLAAGQVTACDNWITAMARYRSGGADAAAHRHTIYSRPYNTGQYQYTKRVGGVLTVVTPPDYAGDSNFVVGGTTDTLTRVQRRREIGVGS